MKSKRALDVYWGVIIALMGALFLAGNLDLIDFHFDRYFFRTYWPVILIIIGSSIVLKSFMKSKES